MQSATHRTIKIFRTATYAAAALLTLTAATLHAQSPTPVIDNDRVRVWDVTLNPGETTPIQHHDLDFVTMYLTGGRIRTTAADGTSTVATHADGEGVFTPAGTDQKLEDLSATPARLVVIELKNHAQPPYPNTTGYPLAFPREGAKKVLENDRVVCWNYTWHPHVRTPMHFHDKDVVLIHRLAGSLNSVLPDGTITSKDNAFGTISWSPGNRSHLEELTKGEASAIIVELK